MSPHLHSSTRRPQPLTETDYDHEISLEDHTSPTSIQSTSRSRSADPVQPVEDTASDSSSRRNSDVPLRKPHKSQRLRKELSKRKYRKYQDRRLGGEGGLDGQAVEESANEEENTIEHVDSNQNGSAPAEGNEEEQPRGRRKKKEVKEIDSAIDILYENQRGLFLCGAALFSSKALGNLDPSPWTNIAHKTSATNPTNAQVPDPSWEWAWKEWVINHENDVDEDGWEYSFAFSKAFSWHGRSWWNSYVRRRAWIRKRVRKNAGYQAQQPDNMLTADYFTVNSTPRDRSQSQSRPSTLAEANRLSAANRVSLNMDDREQDEEICNINALMTALKLARIDREKLEVVKNFIRHGEGDLYYLQDRMHDIMKMFIFQASRKILLAHLHQEYDSASKSHQESQKSKVGDENEDEDGKAWSTRKRLEYLSAALEHADEEVKKLEFWSDVKEMAESGDTKHAVDARKGWEVRQWEGIDNSGPKDVISQPEKAHIKIDISSIEGKDGDKGNETTKKVDKGKGKEGDGT
ncbi:hypothetical protein HYALB_00010106 [Hymenoscyphus albidus]|uniref:Peroxin/Ferlin domain-containing protein n=1 Tax=Hymenoscyphus albidus TaxID=595503 RepID=A0A9N9Q4D0_9HELO|nr:hypothetical protein HYALB_00010106 [Hymenoscyphus albidus]